MHISISREDLLRPLGHVAAIVERRQTLPILSNVLLQAADNWLKLTGTDLEVELVAGVELKTQQEGMMTVPARKLYDICRALPAQAQLEIHQEGDRAIVRSAKSRFSLATLPSKDFPAVEVGEWELECKLEQAALKRLLERTQFCMAHQDVRYYLNGLLVEASGKRLRAVATDGHRMGLCEVELESAVPKEWQVIVPRKGVLEMTRFLAGDGPTARLQLSNNHARVSTDALVLTSKLVDGRFPDYQQVLPASYRRLVRIDRIAVREALARAAILANEKYRGVRLIIKTDNLQITAHNPEQEEAREDLPATYEGEELEIGFNVNYVLEALGGLDSEEVELGINEPTSSCALQAPGQADTRYVVMPMRL